MPPHGRADRVTALSRDFDALQDDEPSPNASAVGLCAPN